MNVYLLPGLGADKRMYYKQLEVLPDAKVLEHLPAIKGESLAQYAARIGHGIDASAPFALIGTSLGGIVSMELTRQFNPEKIILISSVKSRDEMPVFIKTMKYLNLHKLISGNGFKRFNTIMAKRLDNRGDKEIAQLIMDMTGDVAPEFIEWAVDAVIRWNPPKTYRKDIVHIHGTSDQLFPFTKINNAIAVKEGSHVMNMSKADEVNRILLQVLNS